MGLFEPEETVGRYWHRLVGSSRTYPSHPDAAVRLDGLRTRLGLLFRACGGSGAVRIVAAAAASSGHRLRLMQAVGLGQEKIERPTLDLETMRLPAVVDIFSQASDNEALYEWLAAWFAHAVPPEPGDSDPLRADVRRLRAANRTTRAALSAWPGLVPLYGRLCEATLLARPRRILPPHEAHLEAAICGLLRGAPAGPSRLFDAIAGEDDDLAGIVAPLRYNTYLPVPLWGDVVADRSGVAREDADEGGSALRADAKRRAGVRKSSDRSGREDPLMLHRFETIFTVADMINVNRAVDDDDEKSARQAIEDMPELTIGSNRKRAATRLSVDLDLAPQAMQQSALDGEHTYPEWDYKAARYRRDYCRVTGGDAAEQGEEWSPDPSLPANIRRVRRQFEALRPRRQVIPAQADGDDLDMAMLVRDVADRRAGGAGTDRIFSASRPAARDLSLAILLDVSLSTDAWLRDCRVLDVEKSALLALTHGLTACGDEHAIFAFTSRRRTNVRVDTVKGFDEQLGAAVVRRIEALKPGQYTRMGAAVRHVATLLARRPQRHRLLLILTDGKPNDIDHYEGRYGIEDTRMAIREVRQTGMRAFGVTVDAQAQDYVPHIFGQGAYAIVRDIGRLPMTLPAIYRQITA